MPPKRKATQPKNKQKVPSREPSPKPEKKVQTEPADQEQTPQHEFIEFPEHAEYENDNLKPKFPYQITKLSTDEECALSDALTLYKKNGKVYQATMNQSSMVGGSNTNKFYKVQVVYSNKHPTDFYLFKRWGRVGEAGNQALIGPQTEQKAIQMFNERVIDRTVRCNYQELQMEEECLGEEEEEEKKQQQSEKNIDKTSCSLDNSLQNLMQLIFDVKIQEEAMKEIGYDPKKCPLGKLGQDTIKDGYKILTKLMNSVENKANNQIIEKLSSDFYSTIPHDFGRKKMRDFILDNTEKVKEKLNMLQSLTDMKIANDLLSTKSQESTNILDQNYKKLNCNLKTLDKQDEMYKTIQQFIDDGKANWKTEVQDIFEVERPGEDQTYREEIGNHRLLWHGSRVTNYAGILSQGLRIAPPEAPVSGYLYGKGIYLADQFSKSAHYCRSETSKNSILIMLIKTALGKPRELHHTDCNAANLPTGTHSTLGWGTQGPPEKSQKILKDGTIVPLGKPQRTKSSTYMGHNEYIVYNVNQAQIKYLIRINLK